MDDARAGSLSAPVRPEAAALACVPHVEYDDALAHVEARMTRPRWLVTIDGRSGSGKTQLAGALHDRHADAQIVHLDDLYRDWDGLSAGLVRARHIAEQWSRHNASTYVPTHWPGTAARGRVTVTPDRPLIVEGVGATWVGRSLAHAALWLEAERETRKRRALERDGETFVPYWLAWELQEDAWFAAHPPRPDALVPVPDDPIRG